MAGNTERKENKRTNGSKLQNKDINDSGYEFPTIKKKKVNETAVPFVPNVAKETIGGWLIY